MHYWKSTPLRPRCLFPILIVILMFAIAPSPAWSFGPALPAMQGGDGDLSNLAAMSIEDLMNIKITSTARKPVKFTDATSAVFVITAEDIRHSGAPTLPDILRMVPGLEVARISANQWAVSARGFNGRFANKLLVLIDGRSIYSPSFSGVYWEVQDLLLEDIQRIEVIRGPGATIWGANAVNGVINIITKSAADTQGGLASMGAGTEERGFVGIRYGGSAGGDAKYRVYAKYLERDGSATLSGASLGDDTEMQRGGFRIDWPMSLGDSATLQGDIYQGTTSQLLTLPILTPPYEILVEDAVRVSGGNVLGRWRHATSSASDLKLQLYYDWTERREATYEERRDTVDFEIDHRFKLGRRQEIVWGFGYRFMVDDIDGTFYSGTNPERRRDDLASAFIQDDITAVENRLVFTLGTKVEHNDYTGYEFQPSVRMLWTPHERHSVWSAVSRAVRTPSRIDSDGWASSYVFPPSPLITQPVLVRINGNPDFRSEELLAYEAGYRIQPADSVFLDFAAFYNFYDNLRSGERLGLISETTPPPAHLVQLYTTGNKLNARVYGLETAVDWRPTSWWTLNLAHTFLQMKLRKDAGSQDFLLVNAGEENPHHQVSLRTSMNMPGNLELDAWLRYVGALPFLEVKKYLTLDVRLGWKMQKNLELVLVGQNLLDDRHQEFVREIFWAPAELERSAYVKAVWTF